MSSLSSPLKALINAPHARPGPLPVSAPHLGAVLGSIAREASAHHLSPRPWLALSVRPSNSHLYKHYYFPSNHY